MLKNINRLLLLFTIICSSLVAYQNNPNISEHPSDLGHIFRDERGHFKEDTPENRTFIESAAASPENKVGIKTSGVEVYLKTMPDGTQAWAEVWKGNITNGGKNNFPKAWVADNSKDGGSFTTPKFSQYSPHDKTFYGHLVVNRITSTYEAYSQTPQYSAPLTERKMLGVTGRYGKILDLIDYSDLDGEHILLLPTSDLSEEEIFQVLRDVAKGIYIYDALPFFSLHFNRHLTSYPVIHPVYRNTLTGEAIAMLDYYMKGFTTGRSFNPDFIYGWDEHRTKNLEFLFSHSFEFKDYCQELGLPYKTFNEILEELMGEDSYHGVFHNCFDISYRIIAKQNAIIRNGNTLSFTPHFDVIGIVEGTPLTEAEENHYAYLRQACQIMSDQIKETLPKLPICQKHFQILYLANFFSYYCNTLKEAQKIPMLERKLPQNAPQGSPKTFPPIPLSMEDEIQISFTKLFETLTTKELDQVMAYFKNKNAPEAIIYEAVDVIYEGLYQYFADAGMETKVTPDQCADITIEILHYCKTRYQNVRQNIADVLKALEVTGSPDSVNTQQNFLREVNDLLLHLSAQEKQEMLDFRDQFNLWFTNPLALCFGYSGVAFSLIDGSLKFISNCHDEQAHLAGGCGITVEDIQPSFSWFLGYFHGEAKVTIPYKTLESETPEKAKEEAKGLLYPPQPEYPLNNTILQVLQAISQEDISLFDQVKGKIEDWEFKDPYSISLAHHAACAQNPYFLKTILTKHVNLSLKDEQGLSPLHHAAKANSLECIKLLVHENPDLLEAKGQDDETPLFIAIQNKSEQAVDLLLLLGANPNCTIINDLSALFWAIQSKEESLSLKLLNHKRINIHYALPDNTSALELAIDMQLPQVLKKLIDLGASVNRRAGGYTPLHTAVSFGYLEGVKILLACPDTQASLLTSSGESAIDLARNYGFEEIERMLLPYFK